MFKRLRQLRISLAAKCQLLFGAAVALIIAAALFVPWQRMEQLTEQINERAARALCEDEIADHIEGSPLQRAETSRSAPRSAIPPPTQPAVSGTTQPATMPETVAAAPPA